MAKGRIDAEMVKRELPKWPRLIVLGTKVTEEQAMEIIIRTDSGYLSSNDKQFCKSLCHAMDVAWEDYHPNYDDMEKFRKKFKVLQLEYMTNDQLTSSYIGGPHGWCQWNGALMTYSYNVGKWPNVAGILNEWNRIADAFPFLELKSQLFDKEACEEGSVPLVEFHVTGGVVHLYEPEAPLLPYELLAEDNMTAVMNRMMSPKGEQGCTIDQFKKALAVTLTAIGGK